MIWALPLLPLCHQISDLIPYTRFQPVTLAPSAFMKLYIRVNSLIRRSVDIACQVGIGWGNHTLPSEVFSRSVMCGKSMVEIVLKRTDPHGCI